MQKYLTKSYHSFLYNTVSKFTDGTSSGRTEFNTFIQEYAFIEEAQINTQYTGATYEVTVQIATQWDLNKHYHWSLIRLSVQVTN